MSNNSNSNTPARPARRGGGFGPGGGHGFGPGEKAKDFKGTMGKVLRYTRPYRLSIIVVLLFAIASTIVAIRGPKIIGEATNKLVEGITNMTVYDGVKKALDQMPPQAKAQISADATIGDLVELMKKMPQGAAPAGGSSDMLSKIPESALSLPLATRPGIDVDAIRSILLYLVALYLISAGLAYVQGFIMSGIAQKITYSLRRDISLKMNRLPLKYYDSKTHGDILSRITNDIDTVGTTLNQSLSQMVTSVVSIVGVLIMMLTISPILTVVIMLVLPLSFVLISVIIKRSQKFFMQQQQSLGKVNGHIEEMFSGHTVMKAFNGETRSIEEFEGYNKQLYGSAWKSQFLSGMMMPLMGFVGNLGYVAVCVVGGWLTVNGHMTIGGIQSFIIYVRQFNQPVAQVANIANVLQSTAAAAERVFEFLEEKDETAETQKPVTISQVKGDVSFENVKFGYTDQIIIKDFSASIKAGQRVAIVGPTGAGKTTIIKLLMRFYELNGGKISVDGTNILDMTRSDLRRSFGMVLQDTWLFGGTIMENIRYGRPDATDAEVIAASKAAHVDHFVRTLPGGYNMVLNEEASNISQGQKQLITIARAMLANPAMLIFDEATSSVDTRTEVLIQQAMNTLMKGRTSFIIAHRLSTIRDADVIFVMRDGDIVEQGSHEALLAKNGFYSQLYYSQFESESA